MPAAEKLQSAIAEAADLLAGKHDWFDQDTLVALLAKLEAIIAEASAADSKHIEAYLGSRDMLAGRLAVLRGDLLGAEAKFKASIAAFAKVDMHQQRAVAAIEAASAMRTAHRLDAALWFAREAIAGAELVWWGLSPIERLTTPEIVVEAADTAIPIAHEAQAPEAVYDFIQRSKARWYAEQLMMSELATLPIMAAFKGTSGPAPELFQRAIDRLDVAWDAYFSGDPVDRLTQAEHELLLAYGAEMTRRYRLRPIMTSTVDARQCQAALQPDEAFLELFVTTHETFAALLTRDHLRVVPLGMTARQLREGVTGGYLMTVLAPTRRTFQAGIDDTHDAEWKETLGKVQNFMSPHRFLKATQEIFLAPFARELTMVRRLIVCPHWVLHLVPFHAVEMANGAPLAQTTVVSYAQSASAWEMLRRMSPNSPAPDSQRVAIFGVERGQAAPAENWFSQRLGAAVQPPQPSEFEKEACDVAAAYNVVPLLGAAAKKAELENALTTADLVHISCHTLADRPQSLTDGLLLADGLLSVAEINASPRLALQPGAKNRPSLIVLSACDSGRAAVQPGDRLISCAHILAARLGCQVICSLWRADAEATSLLMARLHEYRKSTPDWAEALRLAQRDTMSANSKPDGQGRSISFRDPYYWANFFLLG